MYLFNVVDVLCQLFHEDEFGELQILLEIISVYLPGAVFPEPHMVLDLSYCKAGMDAQGYSEGIAGSSPPASPRPV